MGKIRFEEYAPLGDFLMESFVRDQPAIVLRFPKLNAVFLTGFQSKLVVVKTLESSLTLTEDQKRATVALYAEADVVNKELNFLGSYFSEAGLSTDAVSDLKKNLTRGNIEGALLQMNDVKQYVIANQAALEEEGMSAAYPAALEAHRDSMAATNALQNSVLNARKVLVDSNKADYKALYDFIASIAAKGKLIFDGTVMEDEYNLTKIVSRMRAPRRLGGDAPTL